MKNYWIFQATPEIYDLRQPGVIQPGKKDRWIASRYRADMNAGDVVFFWLSGDPSHRGIYAWGELLAKPTMEPDGSFGVDAVYHRRLSKPVLADELKRDSILADLQIFRIPVGTNFLLEPAEADALIRSIKTKSGPNDAPQAIL